MRKLLLIVSTAVLMLVLGTGCNGVTTGSGSGDTLRLGYAERIKIVEYEGFNTVTLADLYPRAKQRKGTHRRQSDEPAP